MTLHLIKYYTMNSWNNSTAPAFNLKVYNVIPVGLQSKVFELMNAEDFYLNINDLMSNFDYNHKYEWQVGFNGRSGGYLVLYRGGQNEDGSTFTYPGKGIEFEDVPEQVLKDFKQLAEDIVAETIYQAEHAEVIEEEVTYTKKVKRIEYNN